MSEAQASPQHPIGLIVTDDLQRNRLTVFFRLLLAIPHLILVALWGIVAFLAVFAAWLVGIFTGRVPDGLHDFVAGYLRYLTRVAGYVFLLADPFPPFGSGGSYPIDARIDPAQEQSRLTIFFRLLLAIPALILAGVFRQVNQIVAFLGWFYALATGRMNEGMRNISAWLLRFEIQTNAYLMLLTGRYPSLSGAPTA
jgi:Domain of unknown function (DUF4389)